jgi:hypothetical protein
VLLVDGDATVEPTEHGAGYRRSSSATGGAKASAGRCACVKTQRRIRVAVRSWRVLDFVKRFPKSLR